MRAILRTILTLLFLSLALPAVAIDSIQLPEDPATLARYQRLTEEFRCLVCQNQTLADSNADLAIDMRREVLRMIEANMTDAEISDWLVERYGDFVLYRPPMKASTWALWFGPLILLLLAGSLAFFAKRRYGATTQTTSKEQPPQRDIADLLEQDPVKQDHLKQDSE